MPSQMARRARETGKTVSAAQNPVTQDEQLVPGRPPLVTRSRGASLGGSVVGAKRGVNASLLALATSALTTGPRLSSIRLAPPLLPRTWPVRDESHPAVPP